MPKYDGTGPWGSGSGTGWGLGPCGAEWAGEEAVVAAEDLAGEGFGVIIPLQLLARRRSGSSFRGSGNFRRRA